ncbi:MAG: CAP domain-containing protein [Elainellaceae cyanobacterium]
MTVNIYAPSPLDGLEQEENGLYKLVNRYRARNDLPPIPASSSLTLVANRHVLDLQENIGTLTHGWSDAPYDSSDSSTWPSMWTAPQRFNTSYPGNGYENAYWNSAGATATSALIGWQGSTGHNNVILNRSIWVDNHWNALGVGIYEDYAVLWFGEEIDPTGAPTSLDSSILTGNHQRNTVRGSASNDIITGLGQRDTLAGRRGSDVIGGGAGRDKLLGGGGNDFLFGEGGNDRLVGHRGRDRLFGGGGRDVLVGGPGRDLFGLQTGNNFDIIKDFGNGNDQLKLPQGSTFRDVELSQRGNTALISIDDDLLAKLRGVQISQLSSADFQ